MTRHVLYSTLMGAGYGVLRSAFHAPNLSTGALDGLGISAINLLGLGLALDLASLPTHESKLVAGRRFMMHIFCGAATALFSGQVRAALPPSM